MASSQPASQQSACVSQPERQVTPPTPTVTRALADNGTISRSTSAPETPCHRPGSCATPARAGEQWMRGTWSSGCSGAVGSPARWSATPAVSQADQGRQRAASHPAPTVTAGVAPATHLWCRAREATWPLAESEARSSEDEELESVQCAPAQCYCACNETVAVAARVGHCRGAGDGRHSQQGPRAERWQRQIAAARTA